MNSSTVKLQEFCTMALLSAESLTNVNVLQYRKLMMESEVDRAALYMTPRNGRSGVCVIVEMPEIESTVTQVLTERRRTISFLTLEEPNLNLSPTTGTQISAEDVADIIEDELGDLGMPGIGELFPDRKTTVPATDAPEGLVGYRTTLVIDCNRCPKPRVSVPIITEVGGSVTFANDAGFADAVIYWTRDGSYPGQANPAAVKYDGNPIDATAIKTLYWAAFKTGYRQSDLGRVENPNVSAVRVKEF